jgi:hypothetical protein
LVADLRKSLEQDSRHLFQDAAFMRDFHRVIGGRDYFGLGEQILSGCAGVTGEHSAYDDENNLNSGNQSINNRGDADRDGPHFAGNALRMIGSLRRSHDSAIGDTDGMTPNDGNASPSRSQMMHAGGGAGMSDSPDRNPGARQLAEKIFTAFNLTGMGLSGSGFRSQFASPGFYNYYKRIIASNGVAPIGITPGVRAGNFHCDNKALIETMPTTVGDAIHGTKKIGTKFDNATIAGRMGSFGIMMR